MRVLVRALVALCLAPCVVAPGDKPPPPAFPHATSLIPKAWHHPVPAWRIQPHELAPPIDLYRRFAPGGIDSWGDGKHPTNNNRIQIPFFQQQMMAMAPSPVTPGGGGMIPAQMMHGGLAAPNVNSMMFGSNMAVMGAQMPFGLPPGGMPMAPIPGAVPGMSTTAWTGGGLGGAPLMLGASNGAPMRFAEARARTALVPQVLPVAGAGQAVRQRAADAHEPLAPRAGASPFRFAETLAKLKLSAASGAETGQRAGQGVSLAAMLAQTQAQAQPLSGTPLMESMPTPSQASASGMMLHPFLTAANTGAYLPHPAAAEAFRQFMPFVKNGDQGSHSFESAIRYAYAGYPPFVMGMGQGEAHMH